MGVYPSLRFIRCQIVGFCSPLFLVVTEERKSKYQSYEIQSFFKSYNWLPNIRTRGSLAHVGYLRERYMEQVFFLHKKQQKTTP